MININQLNEIKASGPYKISIILKSKLWNRSNYSSVYF